MDFSIDPDRTLAGDAARAGSLVATRRREQHALDLLVRTTLTTALTTG